MTDPEDDAGPFPWNILCQAAARARLEDYPPGSVATPIDGCITGLLTLDADAMMVLTTAEGELREPKWWDLPTLET